MKREEQARRWAQYESGWKSSGLTQRRYCERESISYASFKRWRLVLGRGRSVPGEAKRFIPVRAGTAESAPAMSRSTLQTRGWGVQIRLRGERAVVLDGCLDEVELGRLIRLLEVLPC